MMYLFTLIYDVLVYSQPIDSTNPDLKLNSNPKPDIHRHLCRYHAIIHPTPTEAKAQLTLNLTLT